MDAEEVQNISALAEQSSKMDESFGQFFDGAARDSTTIFIHTPMCPAQVASGVHCDCSFSSMNLKVTPSIKTNVHQSPTFKLDAVRY